MGATRAAIIARDTLQAFALRDTTVASLRSALAHVDSLARCMTPMPFVEGSNARIKALALDGIRPDAERVRRGEYPLTRSSFLVTSASPSAAVAQFIGFVRSDAS